MGLMLAGGLYVVGFQIVARGDLSGFHSNLLAEGIGVLLALAVAWVFIERHFQNQARRVSETVRSRISVVRNLAATQVTTITTAAFDIPAFDSHSDGFWYVRNNYSELRELVSFQGVKPKWFRGGNRDPGQVAPLSQSFGDQTRFIDQTIRLFGSGLLEYPILLQAFERFDGLRTVDQKCWDRFWKVHQARRLERQANIMRQPVPEKLPEIPLAPYESLANLLVLADGVLDIVVAVTLILDDWDSMPGEQEAIGHRVIYNWTYNSNDYDPFGFGKAWTSSDGT